MKKSTTRGKTERHRDRETETETQREREKERERERERTGLKELMHGVKHIPMIDCCHWISYSIFLNFQLFFCEHKAIPMIAFFKG